MEGELLVSLSLLLFVLGIVTIMQAWSLSTNNGVELESPWHYIIVSSIGLLTAPIDFKNPSQFEVLLFVVFLVIIIYLIGNRFVKLGKITIYHASWIDIVKIVTTVLEKRNVSFEGKAKKSEIAGKHSYHFHLLDYGKAEIIIKWDEDAEPDDYEDITVEMKKYRTFPTARNLHNQFVQGFKSYRGSQKVRDKQIFRILLGVVIIIIASFLFYIL